MADLSSYHTLSEYRRLYLKLRQTDIARLVGCKQGSVAMLEKGHLPLPWNTERWLKAYSLLGFEADFTRMVLGSKDKEKASSGRQ